jgi:thiamine-phosphate pyrophosphorylase
MCPVAKQNSPIRGLYAITPDHDPLLNTKLDIAFDAGVHLLQYRRKSLNAAEKLAEATALCARTQAAGAIFIVNDDLELAVAVGANGVHWGRDDVSLGDLEAQVCAAKHRMGDSFLVGLSCYNDLSRAGDAISKLVDYIAFGSIFASNTKPGAEVTGLSLLRQASAAFPNTPIVAIGGITRDNIRSVVAAGADAAAVITDLFDAVPAEIGARVNEFQQYFLQSTDD